MAFSSIPSSTSLPWREPVDVFAAFEAEPGSLFLDSVDQGHTDARWSFIAARPLEWIVAHRDSITVHHRDGRRQVESGNPFDCVGRRLAAMPFRTLGTVPFTGGAAGLFGYDLADTLERMPQPLEKTNIPDMAVGIYDQVVAFDHRQKTATLYSHTGDTMLADLVGVAPARETSQSPLDWHSDFTRAEYEAAVRQVIDHIYAGDIYQANLSQRFTARLPDGFDPFAHYRILRTVNPAPFAAYLNLGDGRVVASASPERFLQVKDGVVTARPIKGTRRRTDDPVHDVAERAALAASEKDRAENIMIVDLLRNDLSRVCDDDSVEVQVLCAVESFATVHHLVSTVTGHLRPDKTALDALKACFPGGSITGAPKIRAMEIIAGLERAPRGPYCGVLGWLGPHGRDGAGRMDMNITIRTLVYDRQSVSFNVGGGITAASDPAGEYQETLDKAAAIFKSFAA